MKNFKKITLTSLLTFCVFGFLSWDTKLSVKEFAEIYTNALVNKDTANLNKLIKPAAYVPFYAKRFKEAKVIAYKDVNDTLSSFAFKSDRGTIHTPVLIKDGEMWAKLDLDYPKDEYSYTFSISAEDNSIVNKGVLSFDKKQFGIEALSEKKLEKERKYHNITVSSVENLSNLKLENDLDVKLNLRITISRSQGKEFVDRQEKELSVEPGKTLKLKELF